MSQSKACARVALVALLAAPSAAQEVGVIEHELDNGLTLLLVPRSGDPNISAGWVAKVGSVYERPGITGVAHLFEHMMFKGTETLGTRNIEEDLQIIAELDALRADIQAEEVELNRAFELGQLEDPSIRRPARHGIRRC